jgi:dipeptidyl aminopeptidase/acylaminoacyl peptidase
LAYFIHGGPQSAWNNQWDVQLNLALFAEHGFVVVAPNPAGSSGFGQAFRDSSRGSWGGLPYTDLERGFEYLQQNENLQYIDTTRAVAVGAGYGGYMVNWIQGHEFGRKFKALVTHDGIFSMTSQLASNRQHFMNELGGPIWGTPDEWRKWDPARFTANWQTPHLVIHCELNYKRVIADGLAAFNVLQLRGVESAFLVFPDEGDPIVNPENNLLWYRTVIDWMRKYCAQNSLPIR